MNQKLLLLVFLFVSCLFSTCSRKEAQVERIELAAEKLYILRIGNWLVDYEDYERAKLWTPLAGMIEIDKNFNVKTIHRQSMYGDFYAGKYELSNENKIKINSVISHYSKDSLYYKERNGIYDGHYSMFVIETSPNRFVRLAGNQMPDELYDLCDIFYQGGLDINFEEGEIITNQDSIRRDIINYSKYLYPEYLFLPPPPEGYELPDNLKHCYRNIE